MNQRRMVLIILVALVVPTIFLFQNCSKVSLERPLTVESLQPMSGKIEICLSGALQNYTLQTSFVANLNLVNTRGTIELDSDGDGVADSEELQYGLNPLQRRSHGKVLDKICLSLSHNGNCAAMGPSCSGTSNQLGLNDCDQKALGLDLVAGHPSQGLDSDRDGIPDLLEIIRGTLPNQIDNLDDPDHDLILNFEEISRGSNPTFHDATMNSRFEVKTSTQKVSNSSPTCGGELWELSIHDLPWIATDSAFQDSSSVSAPGLSLSRAKGSNVGVVILKLVPRPGQSGYARVMYRPLLLNSSTSTIDGSLADFHLAGEVLP